MPVWRASSATSFWRVFALGLLVYFLSSLAWFFFPWLVGFIPNWLAPYGAAVLGPPITLVWGKQAVPFFSWMSLFVVSCILLSRWAYQRDDESHFFVVWLGVGAFFWLVAGWYSWAASI